MSEQVNVEENNDVQLLTGRYRTRTKKLTNAEKHI